VMVADHRQVIDGVFSDNPDVSLAVRAKQF
jgi:hypothetical protein